MISFYFIKVILTRIACFLNRNLRYGSTKLRLIQFVVIRSRSLLKKFILQNDIVINRIGKAKVSLKDAGVMELLTSDYIDKWLYTGADFEPHIKILILKYLKPGDNFLDIGANIGYFSLIAAKKVSSKGQVFSFEPNPVVHQRFIRNIQLNKLNNVSVVPKALSFQNDFIEFKTPSNELKNSGRSSFRDIEEEYTILKVETVQLDSILDQIPHINLLKIDIEGAEFMALQGMRKFLERDMPIIIMELSDVFLKQLGSSAVQVLSYLDSFNYDFFIIGEELTKIDDREIFNNRQFDILCLSHIG